MKIAVVGAGIAGLTVSFLLKEQGHQVTLFEQAKKCMPVGAGILLQPSGQRVLSTLGLLSAVEEHSPKLEGLHAQTRSGKTLVSLRYDSLAPELYGLGVRRSLLFSILFERCQRAGVELVEDAKIVSVTQSTDQVSCEVKHQRYTFDLLIAADGSRSSLRTKCFPEIPVTEYSYAALWAIARSNHLPAKLWQMVDGTTRLIGVLPIEKNLGSFFWGIRQDERQGIWTAGLSKWKADVLEFEPSLSEIMDSIESLDQLAFATYRHAQIKRYHQGRIVFIGDAAHASSPHLGQGVNLALEDAFILADEFSRSSDYSSIFARYHSRRTDKTKYYSRLTAILTPFFQSDYPLLGFGRDLVLPLLPHLPFIGGQMINTMSGFKGGWFDFK